MSADFGPLRFNSDADVDHFRVWCLEHEGIYPDGLEDWEVQAMFDRYEKAMRRENER